MIYSNSEINNIFIDNLIVSSVTSLVTLNFPDTSSAQLDTAASNSFL